MDLSTITHNQVDLLQNLVKHYLENGDEMININNVAYHIKEYYTKEFNSLRHHFGVSQVTLAENINDYYFINDSINISHALTFYCGTFNMTLKTIKRREKIFFLKMFNEYSTHLKNNPCSLLSKIYGCFKIRTENAKNIYILLMNNILPHDQDVNEIYDLKGSLHNRISCSGSRILKDQNWINNRRKLHLKDSKSHIIDRIKIDADFLNRLGIIDYSILIGIKNNRCNFLPRKICERFTKGIYADRPNHIEKYLTPSDPIFCRDGNEYKSDFKNIPETYYIGIIDFLTFWSRRKKIENFINEALCCKGSISCVNPDEYNKRFIEMVEKFVLIKDEDFESYEY